MGKWIIVPEPIISRLKNKVADKLQRIASSAAIKECLDDFIDNDLEKIAPAFYKEYGNEVKSSCSEDKLKRAINQRAKDKDGARANDCGIYHKDETKIPVLLDLICYYGLGLPWKEVLITLNIDENKIETKYSGKANQQTPTSIESSPRVIEYQPVIEQIGIQLQNFSKSLFHILNDTYWNSFVLPESEISKLHRYYTHTDSSLIYYAIANGIVVPPDDFITIADSDGNIEQRTITEALKSQEGIGLYLIKVILEGGVGKTSFVYWLAFTFKDSYNFISVTYLGSVDHRRIIQEATTAKKKNRLPVVFLFDNVSDSSISANIKRFMHEVNAVLNLSDSIFIIAERASRYESEFSKNAIEALFGGNFSTIQSIHIDELLLFEEIYSALSYEDAGLDDKKIKENCKDQYLKTPINSISEKTFFLIQYLKLKNQIIYRFDWEDWYALVPSPSPLKQLYPVVACFYQFGIKVPVGLQSQVLGYSSPVEIVSAIHSFGNTSSPIELTEDGRFMKLHHEHVAEWFFRIPENVQIARIFFAEFLKEISTETNAKLLRKIRKVSKLEEFRSSFLSDLFDLTTYINIIDSYLDLPSTSIKERIKMLVERGLVNLSLGRINEAINSFESVLDIDKFNNHAKDQLARIYLASSNTYDKALNYYYQIYKNDGMYALRHIHAIINRCKEEGISLSNFEMTEFTEAEQLEIITLSIERRFFKQALEILDTLVRQYPSYEAAKQYNLIAHLLPFSNETIKEKETLYLKAVDCVERVNSDLGLLEFQTDYAAFLYRIRRFSKCASYRRAIIGNLEEQQKSRFEDSYLTKIRRINKLFFVDVPDKGQIMQLETFLYTQCRNAASNINRKVTSVERIIQGILILHTVRYHAWSSLPHVFSDATLQLGYAYTYHVEKPINNLLEIDRRTLGENYYDLALKLGAHFSVGDCYDMLRNLQDFKLPEKSKKVISLVKLFFSNPENRRVPSFYRMRGNAHGFLGNYEQAMKDYEKSQRLISGFKFKNETDRLNDEAFLLNNIASLTCDMHEKGISMKGYDLIDALRYCTRALALKPKFDYGSHTYERIKRLLGE